MLFWSKYRSKQLNLERAKHNQQVNELMEQHYHTLHKRLVRSSYDEDVFTDTFLKMTYCYQSGADFIAEFTKQFAVVKGRFIRYDGCTLEIPVSQFQYANTQQA